jgi:hypothetical protein
MGYYMGDFYRGYRGDPGFFSFLGGLAKKAVGFIPGVGPAISGGIGAITAVAKRGAPVIAKGREVIMAHPVLSAAGAAGVVGAAGVMAGRGSRAGAGMSGVMPGGAIGGCHRGPCRRINPRTGKCIRRMNVTNVKALRRSLRRTHGFAKLAMKTIHLVHPKKHATFGGFKKRRKK